MKDTTSSAAPRADSAPPEGTTVPASPLPARRRQRAAPALAAAAAVLALVGGALVVRHVLAEPHPASSSPAAPSAAAPGYRLVGPVSNLETAYLDCVTASVCYAWFTTSATPEPSERTSDGGATWQPLASLPGGAAFDDTAEPSCPTAEMCVAVTEGLTLAMTTDGGTSWRLDQLPAPHGGPWGQIDQVSCATVRECVVHVTGGKAGTFLSTGDGGQTWIGATDVPGDAPQNLQLLRCDPGGQCIGAVSAGLGTASVPGQGPGVRIMRSADHGLTWTASSTDNVPSRSTDDSGLGFLMSCGDAMHCMYAAGSGVGVTSDGGATWQQPATPAAWDGWTISSVSCAADLDCSVALAPALAKQQPVIEATSDAVTWTAQPLPSSSDPLQYVSMLACPSPGGCIGLGSTLSQDEAAFRASQGFDHGIIQTSPQLEFSSLGG